MTNPIIRALQHYLFTPTPVSDAELPAAHIALKEALQARFASLTPLECAAEVQSLLPYLASILDARCRSIDNDLEWEQEWFHIAHTIEHPALAMALLSQHPMLLTEKTAASLIQCQERYGHAWCVPLLEQWQKDPAILSNFIGLIDALQTAGAHITVTQHLVQQQRHAILYHPSKRVGQCPPTPEEDLLQQRIIDTRDLLIAAYRAGDVRAYLVILEEDLILDLSSTPFVRCGQYRWTWKPCLHLKTGATICCVIISTAYKENVRGVGKENVRGGWRGGWRANEVSPSLRDMDAISREDR